MRRILKILTSRLIIVVPLVILQFGLFAMLLYGMADFTEILPFLSLISIVTSIFVLNRTVDPAYKISWILVILGAPIIGIPLYLLAGNRHVPKKLNNGTIEASKDMDGLLQNDDEAIQTGAKAPKELQNVFKYTLNASGFPVYCNTESKYYASGEAWFPEYLSALKQAKHFIFIEFFIIDEGTVWDEIHAVLKEKVSEGVDVKIIYDDFGSITMPHHYDRQLQKEGIEAYRFNHVRPAFIVQMNNRDHRKITVIDNNVAFTGGVNLADEYVNRIKRFGYWKDSAIKIHGEAVWSLTVMFLGMYSYVRTLKDPIDYQKYHLPCDAVDDKGFYQPYSDTPTDNEPVALNMHLNLVTSAEKYIYIDTPYLILPETMAEALIRAAKSGVDVRILTPHIPDKIGVFQITRGYYQRLVEKGVKIYEYLPGFNHAKNFVSDDRLAIVGSANTDYRSYFLHFENGVLMGNTPEIAKIRDDFLASIAKSHQITEEELKKEWAIVRLFRAFMNIFIPLV
jgi:cardiolipin synthase